MTSEQITNMEIKDASPTAEADTDSSSPARFIIHSLPLQLGQFEGPFEVLLYLIKEQEIDIFDIPIVQVTQQYLQFLEMLRVEHLDVAGDFLVLAATLIQIKSRMILPVEVEQEDEEDIEEEDPRLELVEKLLEYRKFRDLARLLSERESLWDDIFGRRVKPVQEPGYEEEDEELLDVSFYDLTKTLRGVLRFLMGDNSHRVTLESASVDEKIAQIQNLLESKESLTWTELCALSAGRIEIVCSLLAILELCRMQRIRARQHGPFGEIRLFSHSPNSPDALEPADDTHVATT
ncbi:MAG TPA: segregation/condensation protein A [Candidatus Hydrogenedentes bacterium]|jgi:segregation and condensation protein A|nr:segregation/condensation protein A [Candidatus Hydrogenedentota bacterium]